MSTSDQRSRIHVAGTARDCEDGLLDRLHQLYEVLHLGLGHDVHFHLFENDSSDQTRAMLEAFRLEKECVTLLLADGLVEKIPRREERIAFCRNELLTSISTLESMFPPESSSASLYFPIDLDLDIDWKLLRGALSSVIDIISRGNLDGAFPLSEPNYYDVYALRSQGWTSVDVWREVSAVRARRLLGRLPKWVWRAYYVESRQFATEGVRKSGEFIEVASAFGGFGVYRWRSVRRRLYASEAADGCEHVAFNRGLRLAIASELCVQAPHEHLTPSHPNRKRQILVSVMRGLRQTVWRIRRGLHCSDGMSPVAQMSEAKASGTGP